MSHPIYRIVACAVVAPYTLRLAFDDGRAETINFEPMLRGELYSPLRDRRVFEQVRLDPETHTLIWPNDAEPGRVNVQVRFGSGYRGFTA